jgi:hypothetical protein
MPGSERLHATSVNLALKQDGQSPPLTGSSA